jgi:hypothetical protein
MTAQTVSPARHRHEWGYVQVVTETVQREVYHPSKVGGLCIECHVPRSRKARAVLAARLTEGSESPEQRRIRNAPEHSEEGWSR